MIREFPADEDQLTLPQRAKSHDGYEFWPSADRWRLSKDVNFGLTFLDGASPEVELGFRLALTRYAEEHSARHTQNMRYEFQWFIRDTGTRTVSAEALINWRAQFDDNDEWKLGALKGFLLAWNGWGFPGVSDDVATLLRDWRIRGNEKGRAVAQTDPHRGPYTDVEQSAILEWANAAVSTGEIELDRYAYLLTVAMTARRPIQIAALRGIDLTVNTDRAATAQYSIRFARAKQRGRGFRGVFRTLPVIEDLYLTLRAQHQMSVRRVSEAVGCQVPPDLAPQIPIFINTTVCAEMNDVATLRKTLLGETPDRLHARTGQLEYWLGLCEKRCTAKSERTGKRIHLLASRFRYTRGTNLRRQGAHDEKATGRRGRA